jgi:hypothetical protein
MEKWLNWPPERHLKAAVRIGFLASMLMAAFWGIWSLFGPVPKLTDLGPIWVIIGGREIWTSTLPLPFAYNRWLDALFAPFIITLNWLALLGAIKLRRRTQSETKNGAAVLLIVGAIIGFGWSLIMSPLGVLICGLVIALIIRRADRTSSFCCGLGLNLGVGLGRGLVLSLSGPIFIAAVIAIVSLIRFLADPARIVFSKETWRRIGAWLIAAGR